jgi:hypothetical protein
MIAVLSLFILGSFLYWGVTFVTLYHLVRFGIGTEPKKFAAVYLIGTIALYCFMLVLFITTDVSWISDNITGFLMYSGYR